MSRIMMGLRIFLMVAFFVGLEANPLDECTRRLKFDYTDLDHVVKVVNEGQLNSFCTNMTSFFHCIDNAFKAETGMTLKEMSDLFKETQVGKALQLLVNVEDLVKELCTEGSQFREDYLATAECLVQIDENQAKQCEEQSKTAFENFNEGQSSSLSTDRMYQPCMVAAYQLGCIGAKVKEECGEQGYNFFKEVVRRIGIFKIGLCPSNIMQTMKTSFIDSLSISESRKTIYRAILELRKRRK